MPLIKRPLALAVASIVSFSQPSFSQPSFADMEYTGSHTEIIHRFFNTFHAGVIVEDATVDYLDLDIQESVAIEDGIIILNSNIDKIIIENNGGAIDSVSDADDRRGNYGIFISNSTLKGVEDDTNVSREVIANHSGTIVGALTDNEDEEPLAPAIGIEDSTVTGNIINVASSDDAGIMGTVGIEIDNTTFNGSISNTDFENAFDDSLFDPESAINTGNPPSDDNQEIAIILGTEAGIRIQNNSTLNGDINNSGHIASYGAAIDVQDSSLTGNIDNSGTIAGDNGIAIKSSTLKGNLINSEDIVATDKAIDIQSATVIGNILNSGRIDSLQGNALNIQDSNLAGNIDISGYIDSVDSIGVSIQDSELTGSISNRDEITGSTAISINGSTLNGNLINSDSGVISARNEDGAAIEIKDANITGNIINDGLLSGQYSSNDTTGNGRGISIESSTFNGTITNTGEINSTSAVSIGEDVLGSLVFNQESGSITGTNQAVLLTDHRFNYLGGNITGDVSNQDGVFYVEGEQVIDGDYAQNSGATLALGLHKASSLTANNISLASGSTLLVDLTKGDIYLQDGATAELLKVSGGTITAENIQYTSTNSLVRVGSATINADGNLEVTIERASFKEAVQQVIKAGKTGQASANLVTVGNTLQQLNDIAGGNQEVAALLNQVDTDNVEKLLPDVSGSALAANTGASTTSGSIVSTRVRTVSAGDMFNKTGLWIQAVYADAEQDDKSGITGYDAQTSGLILGADGETDSGAVYGVAYTYTDSDSDTNDGNATVSTDYNQLTGYWGYSLGNVLMDGQVYYGKGNNDARRLGLGGIASADFDTTQYGLRLSSGYNLPLSNGVQLTPRVSLDYSQLTSDAYTETGTASGLLSVEEEKLDRLELGLNVEVSKSFQVGEMLMTPKASLGIYHDFEAEAQTVTAAFLSAPTTSFTSEGADVSSDRYVAAIGAEFAKGDNFTAQVEYNYNWKDSFDAHTGAIKLRWEF